MSLKLPLPLCGSLSAGLVLAVVVGGAAALLPSRSAVAAGPFQPFVGNWTGGGQIIGSNGVPERIRCRARGEPRRGFVPDDRLRQRQLPPRHPDLCRGFGTDGPRLLAGDDSQRLGPADRKNSGRPVRGRRHGSRLYGRDFASVERSPPDGQHRAERRRHRERAHRTRAAGVRLGDRADGPTPSSSSPSCRPPGVGRPSRGDRLAGRLQEHCELD